MAPARALTRWRMPHASGPSLEAPGSLPPWRADATWVRLGRRHGQTGFVARALHFVLVPNCRGHRRSAAVAQLLRQHAPILDELCAATVAIEAQQPDVVVDGPQRAIRFEVAALTDGDRVVAVDGVGLVSRLPRAGRVRVLQPISDDGVAADDRVPVWLVSVRGIRSEQVADRRAVIGAPRVDVGIEPALDV